MNSKFYLVLTKCGHVGRNYYVLKTLPIKADSAKEAASLAKNASRVKHDRKDAIINVYEVTEEEYNQEIEEYDNDLYFEVHSRQDQKRYSYQTEELKIREEEIENKYDCFKSQHYTTLVGRREKKKRKERDLYKYLNNQVNLIYEV